LAVKAKHKSRPPPATAAMRGHWQQVEKEKYNMRKISNFK